jgi:hypothetical protein
MQRALLSTGKRVVLAITLLRMFPWVSITPLGLPVVPLV